MDHRCTIIYDMDIQSYVAKIDSHLESFKLLLQVDTCAGKCSKKSPGRGWKVTGVCNK